MTIHLGSKQLITTGICDVALLEKYLGGYKVGMC